jgi:hypothetical protein
MVVSRCVDVEVGDELRIDIASETPGQVLDVILFYGGYDFLIVAEKSRQKGSMLTT